MRPRPREPARARAVWVAVAIVLLASFGADNNRIRGLGVRAVDVDARARRDRGAFASSCAARAKARARARTQHAGVDGQGQGNGEWSGRLPDFIIAGVMKGGTSAHRKNIAKHPDIAMLGREQHWFDHRTKGYGPTSAARAWHACRRGQLARRHGAGLPAGGTRPISTSVIKSVTGVLITLVPAGRCRTAKARL